MLSTSKREETRTRRTSAQRATTISSHAQSKIASITTAPFFIPQTIKIKVAFKLWTTAKSNTSRRTETTPVTIRPLGSLNQPCTPANSTSMSQTLFHIKAQKLRKRPTAKLAAHRTPTPASLQEGPQFPTPLHALVKFLQTIKLLILPTTRFLTAVMPTFL